MKKTLLCLMAFFVLMALNAQEDDEQEYIEFDEIYVVAGLAEQDIPEKAAAQPFQWNEFPWTLGAAAEYGLDTREGFAPGYGIVIDRYLFSPHLALGLRGTMYNNSQTVRSTEALVTLRLYAPEINIERLYFFAQLGFGFAAYREESRDINTYLMDLTAGFRLHGKGFFNRFYVEPFVRTGFPFMFAGGIIAGRRFNF